MEHKINALIDLRIEMYRHALFRHYAIECDNFTNAMYYQLLYLDAYERFMEIKYLASQEDYNAFLLAVTCYDYR